jgi:DNA adenine methylase
MGGKHGIAARLAALLPQHICFVEVFAGAANVLFAKSPSQCEVINDINSDLINLFRIIRWHPEELFNELAFVVHSRQEFVDYHAQPGLTDIQKAARYWYKLKTTFGGQGCIGSKSFAFGLTRGATLRRVSLEVITEAHCRLDGVYIENDDFETIIRRYDRASSCFFCDPPYWEMAGYKTPFGWQDHKRLSDVLRKIKGKFLLTINDHKDIRLLYKGCIIRRFNVICTIAKNQRSKRAELLVANFNLPKKLW